MNKNILEKLHVVLALALAIFFIYKGYGKYTSDTLKPLEQSQVVEYIFKNNSYAAPVGYNIVMNTFKQSGFLGMIALFQILAGILIILPKTRLVGLLFLLPMIFNIFFMHIFFDNRMDENIETGILLGINCLLLLHYKSHIASLFRPR